MNPWPAKPRVKASSLSCHLSYLSGSTLCYAVPLPSYTRFLLHESSSLPWRVNFYVRAPPVPSHTRPTVTDPNAAQLTPGYHTSLKRYLRPLLRRATFSMDSNNTIIVT